jgi:hypothetical protein
MQEEIEGVLVKTPWFSSLSDCIIVADKGDALNSLSMLLSKTGLAIVIEPIATSVSYSGSEIVLTWDDANPIMITVFEDVNANRNSPDGKKKRASEVAVQIIKAFKPSVPATPCCFTKAVLQSDSDGKCVYSLSGRAIVKL